MERSNSYAPPVALSRVRVVLCAVAVGCAGEAPADPAASVVEITATGCRPTANVAQGVVIGDELVATVAHAVAGEEGIIVRDRSGADLVGEVVAIDTVLDAALVRVEGLDARAVDRRAYVDTEPVSLLVDSDGDVIAVPAEVARRVTVRTSDIYRDGEHTRPALDIVADVRAGNSGAPIVGEDDNVVALVWAASRRTENRAWALPIEAITPLIDAARSGEIDPPVACSR